MEEHAREDVGELLVPATEDGDECNLDVASEKEVISPPLTAMALAANSSSSSAKAAITGCAPETVTKLVLDDTERSPKAFCDCGNEADPHFCMSLISQYNLDISSNMCRECKAVRLLEEHVEVDKYCYSGWLFSSKKKLLRLRHDQDELMISFWPAHRSSKWQVKIPVRDILGVVFGAYTCTFKKQSSENMPPHWAAFSLVARHRTYDFAARDPEVVECCVRTFQKAICDRRSDLLEKAAKSGINVKTLACPDLGAFDPWPLGFFLWMRLRFRLQDEANKRRLGIHHMLWIVFMKCAFLTSDERSKARFIDMAEQLRRDGSFGPMHEISFEASSAEMRELSTKIQFQKDREMAIVKDRYECRVDTFLPRAPTAVLGSPKQGNKSQQPQR